ncbi:MAG: hypothetical protein ACXVP0_14675 [Bacteroidia bacterium]
MTIALAIEYIPRRMKDLGFGSDYYLRFRHFVLQAAEQLNIDADNHYYILVDEVADVSIASDFGIYDLSDPAVNEQNYEHQGKISITNNASGTTHVRFIQVIPKNN